MPSGARAFAAAALLLVGIVCGGLYKVVSGTEQHSYAAGAPPTTVHVTAGKVYTVAVPGGVQALQAHRIDPRRISCQWSSPTSGQQLLAVVPAGAGTKATEVVATFVAPVTGPIHVDCAGWGAVFVDDADDAPGDLAGFLLLVCGIGLTAGAALALASLYDASRRRASAKRTPSEDEEVERFVHLVHVRSEHGEVGGRDGTDIAP